MDFNSTQFKGKYLGGVSYDTHSIRKRSFIVSKCDNEELVGKSFIQETKTPRDKDGFYLTGNSIYYIEDDSKHYKSVEELLNSMV